MATITNIGNTKFRAQVRMKGHPTVAKTFAGKDAENQARVWAAGIELDISHGKAGSTGKKGETVGDTVTRFLKERDVSKSVSVCLRSMREDTAFGAIPIWKLTSDHVYRYIKAKNFSAASGAFHFSNLKTLLKTAKISYKFQVPEVMDEARERLKFEGLIGKTTERDRRPTEKEIQMLLTATWPTEIPMPDIICFAIASTFRQSEILRIARSTTDLHLKTTLITKRKHPTEKETNDKIVPLLDEGVAIIKRQVKDKFDDRIFPFEANNISNLFTRVCKELGIKDLHFHDLRHEAISRLFEMGYQIQEVAMFSGHRDWKMLRRYTHLKAKDIRRLETTKENLDQIEKQTEVPVTSAKDWEEFQQFLKMKEMMKMMDTQKETA